jgi:hypothetical protein
MFASLDRQVSALREAIGRVDVGTVDAAGARELVALGEQIERLGRSLTTAAAAQVAATGAWRGAGDRTPEEWLARTTGTTRVDAARTVETGARLAQLPRTAEALRNGAVSARQAGAIASAATASPANEARLLGLASHASVRELEDACRRTIVAAEPDPETRERRIHARRSYRTWTDAEGIGHLQVSGPVATIARIDNAVRHLGDRIFRGARRAGRREPTEAYLFDAVEQLATTTGGAEAAPVPRGADAKVIVRIDHSALLRGRAVEGEVCEIAGVGPIPVSVVEEWMGDAFVAAVLTKGTEIAKVVHLGRRFTSEQRTALQWQDPVCARSGCANRLGLQYDHFIGWAETHETRSDDAKRFCTPCHRLKSAGWEVGPPGPDGRCEFRPAGGPGSDGTGPFEPQPTLELAG